MCFSSPTRDTVRLSFLSRGVNTQSQSSAAGRELKEFTFVDMLCRGGRRVEKGETEEREERQSSPLGHHFSQINLCRLQEPRGSVHTHKKKKKSLKSPGHLLEMHEGQKSSESCNVQKHPEPGTLKTGRMKHVAGEEKAAGYRDCFLNLVEAEVGEKTVKSIHCHGGAERGRKHLRVAERNLADFTTPKCVKCVKDLKELTSRKDKIRLEGEISAAASSLLTDGT